MLFAVFFAYSSYYWWRAFPYNEFGGMRKTNYSVLKNAVPLDESAERYGTVRRGFMLCPFHADRVPSLKLYGDHFHCFGCGAHGDVVDLTAGLLGCSKAEAARRLEVDFGSASAHPRGSLPASASSSAAGRRSHRGRNMRMSEKNTPRLAGSASGRDICSRLAQAERRRGGSSGRPRA